MSNIAKAIRDFSAYLAELPTATAERRTAIRRDAQTTSDLMSCTPTAAWDRDDFRSLDALVGRVMAATAV